MTTYLVTGASRGIGYELCRQLKTLGETVIAVCRSTSEQLNSLGVRVEAGIDITSDESVADLVKRLKGTPIDVLVNNAGIFKKNTLEDLDFDSIRQQFEVNSLELYVSPMLCFPISEPVQRSLSLLAVWVLSRYNTSGSSYGYRMSKAALSMAGKSLALDLKPRQIAVAILHPGMVSTDMTGHNGIPTSLAVQGLLARINELNLDSDGTFWHANGEVLPW